MDLVLSGRWLTAGEAKRLGLVARVVTEGRLFPVVLAEARRFARLDAPLVSRLKRTVREGADRSLSAGLALERRLAAA